MPDHSTFLASSSDKGFCFSDWGFLELCCPRLPPTFFFTCARIGCELHSGNSTRLMQKSSPWPMVCLSNWQGVETQRAGTAFLHSSWISLGQKPLAPFAKPYLRALRKYFQFAHPKVAIAMLFIIMENWLSLFTTVKTHLDRKTLKKKKRKRHKHSWDNSNSNAEAALLF